MKIKIIAPVVVCLLIIGFVVAGSGCSAPTPTPVERITVMKETPDHLPPSGNFAPFSGQNIPQSFVIGSPYHPGDKIFIILAVSKNVKGNVTFSRFTFFNQQTKEETVLPIPKDLKPFEPGQIDLVAFKDLWTVPSAPGAYELRVYVETRNVISAQFVIE